MSIPLFLLAGYSLLRGWLARGRPEGPADPERGAAVGDLLVGTVLLVAAFDFFPRFRGFSVILAALFLLILGAAGVQAKARVRRFRHMRRTESARFRDRFQGRAFGGSEAE